VDRRAVGVHWKPNHNMKHLLITIFILSLHLIGYGQENYTSRKGSKFFPGHLDIFITIDKNELRYELFNHWYTGSYAQLRQITIKLDSLEKFNFTNDSITISILKNKVHLTDKKFRINKNVKHRSLCTSIESMRKISYAYKVSSDYEKIMHYDLYKSEDLNLSEEEFKKKVIENLNDIKENNK